MPELTILSNPISERPRIERASRLLTGGVPRQLARPGGDVAVLTSLLRGLDRAGVNFNWNPARKSAIAPVVLVQSNVEALRCALEWKALERIRTLLCGPNLVVWSSDHAGIIGDPEVDVCLVPSEWVKIAYQEDNQALVGRTRVWAAGVDETWWRPSSKRDERKGWALLYKKTEEVAASDVRSTLEDRGYSVAEIAYGSYDQHSYRNALDSASLGVFLSRSESQGLALAEAWAMDVPTLVWDPGELVYRGRTYSTVSSAPYLTKQTGRRWTTLKELGSILDDFSSHEYRPRDWLLQNMTDLVAAQKLMEVVAGASK